MPAAGDAAAAAWQNYYDQLSVQQQYYAASMGAAQQTPAAPPAALQAAFFGFQPGTYAHPQAQMQAAQMQMQMQMAQPYAQSYAQYGQQAAPAYAYAQPGFAQPAAFPQPAYGQQLPYAQAGAGFRSDRGGRDRPPYADARPPRGFDRPGPGTGPGAARGRQPYSSAANSVPPNLDPSSPAFSSKSYADLVFPPSAQQPGMIGPAEPSGHGQQPPNDSAASPARGHHGGGPPGDRRPGFYDGPPGGPRPPRGRMDQWQDPYYDRGPRGDYGPPRDFGPPQKRMRGSDGYPRDRYREPYGPDRGGQFRRPRDDMGPFGGYPRAGRGGGPGGRMGPPYGGGPWGPRVDQRRQGPYERRDGRGPSQRGYRREGGQEDQFDVRRYFRKTFLDDPWKALEASGPDDAHNPDVSLSGDDERAAEDHSSAHGEGHAGIDGDEDSVDIGSEHDAGFGDGERRDEHGQDHGGEVSQAANDVKGSDDDPGGHEARSATGDESSRDAVEGEGAAASNDANACAPSAKDGEAATETAPSGGDEAGE
ncbi:hypothetical protein DFJ74DRAFT_701395 [Hyaloraphidium curvatum]|nr:hypothetical protein DFJ74DRAFT_701395 [Hyaloraphidium curvatum]